MSFSPNKSYVDAVKANDLQQIIAEFQKKEQPTLEADTRCIELLNYIDQHQTIPRPSKTRTHKCGYILTWGDTVGSLFRCIEITIRPNGDMSPSINKSINGVKDSVDWVAERLQTHPYLGMQGRIEGYIVLVESEKGTEILGVYCKEASQYLLEELRNNPHNSTTKPEQYRVIHISDTHIPPKYVFE